MFQPLLDLLSGSPNNAAAALNVAHSAAVCRQTARTESTSYLSSTATRKVLSVDCLIRFFTMSTTLPRLDAITGAPLIGTWASSLVYMAELLQAIHYFRTFKKDDWKLKSYVAIAFTIDTISAIADYACVYLYTITHAGDLVYLTKQNWGVPLYIISTTTVALLVQSFLAFRYWRFTNNTIIVCFFAHPDPGSGFGGGFSSGLTIALFPAFKDRNKVQISATVWIVTQVAADIIIAGALVLELMKAKSVFKGQQRRVNNMLNRLVLHTIQTGTATAVIAVLALIAFLIDDETNIPVGVTYPLGRIYVLSMLMNLNIRKYGRPQNSTINGGQRGPDRIAHGTTYNFTAEFYSSESHGSNRGTVKSKAAASISETHPSEIAMVSTSTQQVPEV
ncbi:hypothetical protein MSAN_02349900 [Mycena sanguinolenta]|uniref:DUF6534 domain-containing protein n=1 Tax=Mycena sanguinolenta TaxID=230812 RepID=A0A8H6X6R3_9AGAR|nr:hypothetical protein MSAN_02349900 [Mycena sanguinolenta]